MAKFDWSTPKQIQIEGGKPTHAPRRKKLSSKGRRKGPKARMDELKAAIHDLARAKEWLANAEVRQSSESWWVRHMKENLDRAQGRYDRVKAAMVKDGLDTEGL